MSSTERFIWDDTNARRQQGRETIGCIKSSHLDLELEHDSAEAWVHAHTRLWYEHVVYTREAIKSRLLGLRDTAVQTKRLLRNQADLAASLTPFLSRRGRGRFQQHLEEHITIAVELVEAAAGVTSKDPKAVRERWNKNGEDIRNLLHLVQTSRVRELKNQGQYRAKNAWCPIKLLAYWQTHLDQTQAEAAALIAQNWEEANRQFDAAFAHMGEYGARLARGFVRLWPSADFGSVAATAATITTTTAAGIGNIFGGGNRKRPFFYGRNPTEYPPQPGDAANVEVVPATERATEARMQYPGNRTALAEAIRREPVAVVLHVKGSECNRGVGNPCYEARERVEDLADTMKDVVFIYNDVERQIKISDVYEYPTVHIYYRGQRTATYDGLESEATYREGIMHALGGGVSGDDMSGERVPGCLTDGDGLPDSIPQPAPGSAEDREIPPQQSDGLLYPVTDGQFEAIRGQYESVVVLYGSDQCKYTRKAKPKFARFAQEYIMDDDDDTRVAFVYWNVDIVAAPESDRSSSGNLKIPYYRLFKDNMATDRIDDIRRMERVVRRNL